MKVAALAASDRNPGLGRRLACALYEGTLLFGVVMFAGYAYSSLTQQRHALVGTLGLQFFLFVVLGIYFVWFWSHGRQTVAMKTWHIRVVDSDGHALSEARALARYVSSWLWFLPPLALVRWTGIKDGASIAGVLAGGIVLYVLVSRALPGGQYVHDLLCRTRLVVRRTAPTGHNRAR